VNSLNDDDVYTVTFSPSPYGLLTGLSQGDTKGSVEYMMLGIIMMMMMKMMMIMIMMMMMMMIMMKMKDPSSCPCPG